MLDVKSNFNFYKQELEINAKLMYNFFMNIRTITTFGAATGLGTLVALSPICQLDARAAIVAGIISGVFMFIRESINESAPSNLSDGIVA